MNKTKVFVRESRPFFLNEDESWNERVKHETALLVAQFSEAIERSYLYGNIDITKFSVIQLEFRIEQSGLDTKIVMFCFGLPSIPVSTGGVGMPSLTKHSRKSKR